MSDIVLSASVRQNLLSLQSTADLLATTQNRLSTGKKVNTALDNPTNYFTARGSTTAPATSTICSTASATACRCCRPPTPASPRCRSWSIPPSRSPTRCCRRRSATRPSRRVTSAANAGALDSQPARRHRHCRGRRPDDRRDRRRHGDQHHLRHRREPGRYAYRAQRGAGAPTTCWLRSTTRPARSRSPPTTMRLRPRSAPSAAPRPAPARPSTPW